MRPLLGYLGFRIGVGIVGMIPRKVAIRLGETMGAAVVPLFGERRRMAARHARRLGVDDRSAHVRRVFAAYGRYWAETLWVRPRRRDEIEATTTLEGAEFIREGQANGAGMIFALPHLGNWEFAGPVGDMLGFELVAVAEDLTNRRIRDWFVDLRRQMGIGIVLATGNTAVLRELQAVLARKGAVALLCDRDIRGRGVPVMFFGEETTLPSGPVSLALQTGAPLFPAAAYFGPGGTHRVVVLGPIELPVGGTRTQTIRLGTQILATALEQLVMRAPDQWHLLQPNWPSDRA